MLMVKRTQQGAPPPLRRGRDHSHGIELAALPEYPPDLNRFLVPAGSLDLPADIYEKDIIIVDDVANSPYTQSFRDAGCMFLKPCVSLEAFFWISHSDQGVIIQNKASRF